MADVTTIINAVASAYTDSAYPNSNFQGANLPLYGNSSARKRVAIAFGTSGLPNGKRIKSVTLRVYASSKSGAGSGDSPFIDIDIPSGGVTAGNIGSVTENSLKAGNFLRTWSYGSITAGAYTDIPLAVSQTAAAKLDVLLRGIMMELNPGSSAVTINVQSQTGANPPKISAVSGDVAITVVNMAPSSGFIDRTKSNTFSWGIAYDSTGVFGTVTAASAKFRWRVSGDTGYTEVNVTGSAYTVPANTFPAGTIEWQVAAVSNDGVESAPSAWRALTTVDSISTAEIVGPKSAFITGDIDNVFEWGHIIATGTAQTKADLQYSTDGETWTPLGSVTGDETSCVIPAGTLPGGSVYWRVRTYNSDNVAGSWSEPAIIMVYASPAAPSIIPPAGIPRPLLNWQSVGQQAFEVRVDSGWMSGAIFGTGKSYQIPLWLNDGVHTLSVRIQSSLGLWSEWASVNVTVSNQPPGGIELVTRSIENGVRLDYDEGFVSYLVYRDDIQIAETTQTTFRDYLTNGKHRYQVRGVVNDYYALSNEAVEITRCAYGILSAVNEIDWILLKQRRASAPSQSASLSRPTKLRYFTGREKPVTEVSEFLEAAHTLEYTFKGSYAAQLSKLRALLGKTVIYKNQHGTLIIGTMSEIEQKNDWSSDVTLTITETDWREGNA